MSAASDRLGESPPMLLLGVVRPLRTIVALADFSPKSDNAVARAALLAREHGAALRLLHVVAARNFPVPSFAARHDDMALRMERARRSLLTLAERTAKAHGVATAFSVRAGDALPVIVDETRAADLVVVAVKRRNPLRDFVLKTPTERLLRIVQRPVLLVKRTAIDNYAELLVAGTTPSHGGVLVESPAREDTAGGDALVVVRKEGQASMASFLLGTPAQRLVAHASCDVLVLPTAVAAVERKRARERRPAASGAGRRATVTPAA